MRSSIYHKKYWCSLFMGCKLDDNDWFCGSYLKIKNEYYSNLKLSLGVVHYGKKESERLNVEFFTRRIEKHFTKHFWVGLFTGQVFWCSRRFSLELKPDWLVVQFEKRLCTEPTTYIWYDIIILQFNY